VNHPPKKAIDAIPPKTKPVEMVNTSKPESTEEMRVAAW
jgi:hypothetical protein